MLDQIIWTREKRKKIKRIPFLPFDESISCLKVSKQSVVFYPPKDLLINGKECNNGEPIWTKHVQNVGLLHCPDYFESALMNCRVISFSNNNRLLHKHLLWQGHNLVIGARSWVDYCLWSVKLCRQNTTHVPCLDPDGGWWELGFTNARSQLMVESQTSTEVARLMIAPESLHREKQSNDFDSRFGIWIIQYFFEVSFIHCMTWNKLTLFNLLSL